MYSVNSLSSINTTIISYSKPVLSVDTINKLKEYDINISSVSSEAEAKKIIEKKTQEKENANENEQTSEELKQIYQRIKTLAMRIDVSISPSEKIESILSKINSKISIFDKDKNNPNINAIRAEYDSIKYAYETIEISKAGLLTGLDLLGETNKAVMGLQNLRR